MMANQENPLIKLWVSLLSSVGLGNAELISASYNSDAFGDGEAIFRLEHFFCGLFVIATKIF
jgi:hypothetical protein